MFDALQNPIVIAIVVLVLLILITIPVLLRRRRAAQGEVLPPPELGQTVDYTSLPYEEPTTLGERLRQAPVGVKLLLGLVPLAIIIAGVVLWYTFFNQPGAANTPASPPAEIRNVTATLAGPARIVVDAETNLPNGAEVTATMKQGDQDFAWFNPDSARGEVTGGKINLVIERTRAAPAPRRDQQQTIILNASANGQTISSQPVKLVVPSIHAREFYQEVVAAPTAAPTAAATAAAAPAPTAAPTAAPTTAATPTAVPELTATVFNGGNIRRQPKVTTVKADVLGQLHAGEIVTLLERSEDSAWYRVKAPEAEGWVSATLLTVDPAIAKQVAVAGQAPAGQTPPATGLTATVFNGGNVRERPVTGKILDQINAKETVQLIEKTSDGAWYRITNIRNVTGWVSVTLLTIDSATAKKVPIAQ